MKLSTDCYALLESAKRMCEQKIAHDDIYRTLRILEKRLEAMTVPPVERSFDDPLSQENDEATTRIAENLHRSLVETIDLDEVAA